VRPRNRFLLSGFTAAAVTANALRPFDRLGLGRGTSFVAGLGPSELPLQTMAVQAAVGLWAARRGGARGLKGAAGLALTGASLAGLWRLHRDGEAAAAVLEGALAEGLGADYRRRIAEPFGPPPEVPLTRHDVLLPNPGIRRRYIAERDIPYGPHGRSNRLDIWRRADLAPDARAPVVIQVHGGAWMVGQKEGQAEPLMAHLAERGWVCVTINYRLSPRATWPDQVVDVKRAIAWTKASIGRHGGDPDFVVITGGSAGGHLTALTALTPGLADFQPGFEDADTSVAAAVPFYGVYDLTEGDGARVTGLQNLAANHVLKTLLADDRPRWEQASPVLQVHAGAPPFFVIHGTNDSAVPVEQARVFVRRLRAASRQPVAYAELPRAQHAFDAIPSVRVHHTAHAVERFLAVVRSEHGGATPAEAVGSAEPAAEPREPAEPAEAEPAVEPPAEPAEAEPA
jgi:acetyl esterase/lipase